MDPNAEHQNNLSDAADIEKNKVMAILAYIIFFIPIIAAKESKFAMYHANQGLILFLAGAVVGIGGNIFSFFISVIPFLGAILGSLLFILALPLVYLAILILAILGIVNASNGKMEPLPVIGKFDLLKWGE